MKGRGEAKQEVSRGERFPKPFWLVWLWFWLKGSLFHRVFNMYTNEGHCVRP